MPDTLDLENVLSPDNMAVEISNRWQSWDMYRQTWKEQTKELRNYLYATDTSTTGNALLPWSNTTTTPKLTQIHDNLHANYFATLFPQAQWMKWEGDDRESNAKDKRTVIQSYIENKTRHSGFVNTCSELLNDWIQTGNCFAEVVWVDDYKVDELGGTTSQYTGPMLQRISPYDIVFNPAASGFANTPKIKRTIHTLGDIHRMVKEDPENEHLMGIFTKMTDARHQVRTTDVSIEKSDGYVADGFSDIRHYYGSDYVEILTFYGDILDLESGEFKEDRVITIVDRAYVLEDKQNPSWIGRSPIFHAGWRTRPDNLYAMGPLDNLVGMQYRIDHLENLKADVFDQIAYPITKIRGDVEDFEFAPAARIIMGEEGDVDYLRPDVTALNADTQIAILEAKMEEMAGAPKQAMGIRTPGEKTAFEVQQLQNSASRIFEHKTAHFERTFLEPILNAMLEVARRKMNNKDTIRTLDDVSGAMLFKDITKEDIIASGRIYPVGARHFAERARRVQNIVQLHQIKVSDPTVAAHMSGKEIARILADELGEQSIFGENIGVIEQAETQTEMQEQDAQNQERLAIQAEEGV